jgi:hypothetical protein
MQFYFIPSFMNVVVKLQINFSWFVFLAAQAFSGKWQKISKSKEFEKRPVHGDTLAHLVYVCLNAKNN